MPTTIII